MREIIFRGKRADNGEWVEGYLIRRPLEAELEQWFIDVPPKDSDKGGVYNVLSYTIGQYIGRKDIHDRKIYEGDIVREYNYDSAYGLQIITGHIYWSENGMCYLRSCSLCPLVTVQLSGTSTLEIIGNKYDGAVFADGVECFDLLNGKGEASKNA